MDCEQKLFLIEFLVDRVNIPVVKAIHEELLSTTTCVSFQILNLPPAKIYQDSSVEGCACEEGDIQFFKKGKSCLFALPATLLQKPLTIFPVTMSVYKELPPGVLPDVMLIGTHEINLKDQINSVLQDYVFKRANPHKAIKDTYKITTATGQCVGDVTVFIRVSCLGKKVITQFQIPHNKKPYLFKGTNDSPVFQCKRVPSNCDDLNFKCTCGPKKPDGSGESATRTCCPTPVAPQATSPTATCAKQKQPSCPRPCCPGQHSPGPTTSTFR